MIRRADSPISAEFRKLSRPHRLVSIDNDRVGVRRGEFGRRWKPRPVGTVRQFANEVRDMLQYVDGVTPWAKAQRVRTLWEVREHHPMPQFHRPELAMHRNHPSLLPTHLWEADKKTGRVRMMKDSVRDYQTMTPVPRWVKL